MKVIDLMQMYANGEKVPKKIKVIDYAITDGEETIWTHEKGCFYSREHKNGVLFLSEYVVPEMYNDEVEVIEDIPGKIKKLDNYFIIKKDIQDKINEIIDYINKGDI